jgi:hypothetical protein
MIQPERFSLTVNANVTQSDGNIGPIVAPGRFVDLFQGNVVYIGLSSPLQK